MSKAVLISIRPKWCELILSGKKTIEIRKTRPKLETPFKCYIYCTRFYPGDPDSMISLKDRKSFFKPESGKVVGEFVCDRVDSLSGRGVVADWALQDACLSETQYAAYRKGKTTYFWHITDLKIYDQPKRLDDFMHWIEIEDGSDFWASVQRPPQSWCYVETLEDQ